MGNHDSIDPEDELDPDDEWDECALGMCPFGACTTFGMYSLGMHIFGVHFRSRSSLFDAGGSGSSEFGIA